ncbi:hypothetical protein DFH06DRAFT_415058 [Mycena polygramma]|nr:hypothetical protein DFH06DRAFT_415058 [Mycena polygramma]
MFPIVLLHLCIVLFSFVILVAPCVQSMTGPGERGFSPLSTSLPETVSVRVCAQMTLILLPTWTKRNARAQEAIIRTLGVSRLLFTDFRRIDIPPSLVQNTEMCLIPH